MHLEGYLKSKSNAEIDPPVPSTVIPLYVGGIGSRSSHPPILKLADAQVPFIKWRSTINSLPSISVVFASTDMEGQLYEA